MIKEYMTLTSAFDELPLSVVGVYPDPEEEVRGILHVVHGMAEHKDRYIPFFEYMAQRGIACIMADNRGHGDSVYSKEDYGYFYSDSTEAFMSDVAHTGRFVKGKFPGVPYYLMGHSMGSLIVRVFAAQHDEDLDGLIVCGSVAQNPMVGMGLFVNRVYSLIRGERYRSKSIDGLATGSYNKQHNEVGPCRWLSVNEENINAFLADEKCGFTFTLNGFEVLFKLLRDTYRPALWNVKNPAMPIFFISGEEDPCTVNREKFEDSMAFLQDMGYKNVSGKMYPGMRHEILNETEKEIVFADVWQFIADSLPEKELPQMTEDVPAEESCEPLGE